jgi:hypothetical protein
LPNTAFEDVVAGDFDNDGAIDLFLARKNAGGRVALARGGESELTAQIELTPQNAQEPKAFRFRTQGTLKVTGRATTGDLVAPDVKIAENPSPDSLIRARRRRCTWHQPPGSRPAC